MLAAPARTVPVRLGAGLNAPGAQPVRPASGGAASDAELLQAIGRDLAAVYAEVLRQPMPAKVKALIEHIDAHADSAF